MAQVRLTVFTPTYNRVGLLRRTFESLLRQTSKDFLWLIVDDGSSDNTKETVDSWRKEADEAGFEIRYHYRENGGKMRAHNTGVNLCDTDLFFCLDSDDYLTDNAVEVLLDAWDEASLCNADGVTSVTSPICGVIAHKGISESEILGGHDFPVTGVTTLFGLYLKGFGGETSLMFKTEVLRKFPFPEIDGEKYVPEDYIYDKIDQIYTMYAVPKIVTVCEIVSEGYTDSVARLKRDNKMAWYLYYEQRAYITPMSVLKLKYLGFYVLYAKKANVKLSDSRRIGAADKLVGYIGAALLKLAHKE